MKIIILLLTVSLFVALIFLIAFLVAVSKGQFDDCYTPSIRILFDDAPQIKKGTKKTPKKITKSKQP